MVAPKRELVNTLFSEIFNTSITPIIFNNDNMDMEVDIFRDKSVSSAHSSIFSIPYIKRMETQSNNPFWADQANKFSESQGLSLSYMLLKERENNT